MLKGEAEQMIRRILEEHPEVTFTDEQITVLAKLVMRISGRQIEEAFATFKPNTPGSRPTFFGQ